MYKKIAVYIINQSLAFTQIYKIVSCCQECNICFKHDKIKIDTTLNAINTSNKTETKT